AAVRTGRPPASSDAASPAIDGSLQGLGVGGACGLVAAAVVGVVQAPSRHQVAEDMETELLVHRSRIPIEPVGDAAPGRESANPGEGSASYQQRRGEMAGHGRTGAQGYGRRPFQLGAHELLDMTEDRLHLRV